MTLENKIAIQLHEDWRKFRENSDGTFESVWHKVDNKEFVEDLDLSNLPANIRVVDGEIEIDIANSNFAQLSPDLQRDYFESAKVVAEVLKEKDDLTLDQIGEKIYNAYLSRNTKTNRKPKSFEKLSGKRQKEILREYRIGLEVLNESKINEKTQEKTMEL